MKLIIIPYKGKIFTTLNIIERQVYNKQNVVTCPLTDEYNFQYKMEVTDKI